jgi:GAF domain-containing protein
LIKPFTSEEVLEVVERALIEKRLQNDKSELSEQLRRSKVEIGRQARVLAIIAQITGMLVGESTSETVARRVLEAAVDLTKADRGQLLWRTTEPDSWHVFDQLLAPGERSGPENPREPLAGNRAAGFSYRIVGGMDLPEPGGWLETLLATGAIVQEARASTGTTAGDPMLEAGPFVELLAVPLEYQGHLHGALSAANQTTSRAFSEHHEILLTILGNLAAIYLAHGSFPVA